MWIPKSFEQRRAPAESDSSSAPVGTELWADGVQISRAVERVAWDKDPIHIIGCMDCLAGDCLDGARLSVRRAGSYVLFLPSFLRWLQGDWYDKGYQDPPAFLQKGAMLLGRALYADLRSLVPALPAMADLQPLAGWEAVRLLRFEAPMEILGKDSEPVRLRRGMVLHTDRLHGDDSATKTLEKLLKRRVDSYVSVALKPLPDWQVPVSFHLGQGPRSVEWQPLASASRDQLLLAPGYVMDEMPELPNGSEVNDLLVRTRPRERPGLETLIWVDQDLLYDFASRGLGVDLFELAQSLDQDGERFIITCSCGHAGCAGIHRGVDVYYGDGTVFWVIYEPAPARTLVFDEQAYRRAVEMGLAEFRQLGAEHPFSFLDRLRLRRLAGSDSPPGGS